MLANLRYFLLIALFCTLLPELRAQDHSYFSHKKYFYLCSFKKQCTGCESCTRDIYKVRIKNNSDKKIKSVFYTFYSPVNQHEMTREAVIEGDMVDAGHEGILYLCINSPIHWAITRIVYADDSQQDFLVDGPISKFHQEADECDCNVPKTIYPYGKPADKLPDPIY